MRGKGLGQLLDVAVGRITPAYAGKRHFGHGQTTASSGSPPPMRGKVRQIRHLLFQIRITPAYAGKRVSL